MLKPILALSALLFFWPLSQQSPVAPEPAAAQAPAPAQAPAATTETAAPAAPTTIPAEAAKMVNPVKPTAASQEHAKKMYGYDCAVCHGPNGNGKGDLAADMKPPLKDYTDPAALKDLTDGEMFYIIKNGKGQMPGEGDRAKPDDMWNMVILVHSFAKK